MVVIDFANESNRLPDHLSDYCSSNGYRHSFVALRRVLPERFDCVDRVHRWRGEAAAGGGEVGCFAVDEIADVAAAADIDECTNRICVRREMRVKEMKLTSINSLIHSFFSLFLAHLE